MSTSLFTIAVQLNQSIVTKNVLASDGSNQTALQAAMAAAIAAAGGSAVFQSAMELGGKPIDMSTSTGTSSDPKAVYTVQFRAGSGPGAGNQAPVMVYVNPAAGTTPEDLAISTAAQTGAVPTSATLLGNVDIDATGSTPPGAVLSKFAFRSLFTLTEQVAIDNHAADTALTPTQQQTITTLLVNFAIADTITLSDPMTVMGVDYLVSAGLLTAPRAAAILAGQAPTS